MTAYRGLTWDHPRGRAALEAAALSPGLAGEDTLVWAAQSLEGFESCPITDLAADWDLLVLDHPHLGDAVEGRCLWPLDHLFSAAQVARWRTAFVGAGTEAYRMSGHLWALPLDAATQVSARRADLVAEAPRDWAAAGALADDGLVALSLAGPHAFLTWCSILVGLGRAPDPDAPRFCEPVAGIEALDLLRHLAARAPEGTAGLNPIALLERMVSRDDIALIPHIFGYVAYADPRVKRTITFGPPPAGRAGVGSTLGGTGLAISRRCTPGRALLEHMRWLVSPITQTTNIPRHGGQPALRASWLDPDLDRDSGGFYSSTLDTMEGSWVRPRFPGFVRIQSWAAAVIRATLQGTATPGEAVRAINDRIRFPHPSTKGLA